MSPSSVNTDKVLISLSSNYRGPDLTILHISDSHLFVPPSRMCRSRKEPLSLFNNDARALLIYWILSGGVWCICQAQVSLGTSLKVSAAGTRNNISSGRGQKVRSSRVQHENKHNINAETSSVFFFTCFALTARLSEVKGSTEATGQSFTADLRVRFEMNMSPCQHTRTMPWNLHTCRRIFWCTALRSGGDCTLAELSPDCPKWLLCNHKIPRWGDGGLVWQGERVTPLWWGGGLWGKLQ